MKADQDCNDLGIKEYGDPVSSELLSGGREFTHLVKILGKIRQKIIDFHENLCSRSSNMGVHISF